MQGEKLRKFTETRAHKPRARYALILPWPKIQYILNTGNPDTKKKRDEEPFFGVGESLGSSLGIGIPCVFKRWRDFKQVS